VVGGVGEDDAGTGRGGQEIGGGDFAKKRRFAAPVQDWRRARLDGAGEFYSERVRVWSWASRA